jgi:hypothetical protein
MNTTLFEQTNFNFGDNDAAAGAIADTGGNTVVGGLVAINAGNPANALANAINVAPVTQVNLGLDFDSIADSDLNLDVL